jgi:DNA-directed RNA polymerase specialized sigma24 family protein
MDKNMLTTVFRNHHDRLVANARRRLRDGYHAQEAVSKTYLTVLDG